MKKEYDYIIVGGGLCGLVLARDLVKHNKNVLILERGSFIKKLGRVRHAFFFYDGQALSKSRQGIIVYRSFGVGGTSIVSCGNAVEFTQSEYSRIPIDFKDEIPQAKKETFVRDQGLAIGPASTRIREVADRLGYDMFPMPKFSITGKCLSCGDCYVGCNYAMKWTSLECLKNMQTEKYDLLTNFYAERVTEDKDRGLTVEGRRGLKKERYHAAKVILCAGGMGTPVILQESGIDAGDNFFADLFNVTYGISEEFNQRRELTMSVVCAKFHIQDGFVLAPFVDNWYSFSSSVEGKDLLKAFKLKRIMGIMNKINDDSNGKIYPDGTFDKGLSAEDIKKLKKGSEIAKEILINCGVKQRSIFVAKPRGAHPGGTAAVGKVVDNNLETKMKNLFVCDASVLPFAPGLPPILALVALTKWFSKNLLAKG